MTSTARYSKRPRSMSTASTPLRPSSSWGDVIPVDNPTVPTAEKADVHLMLKPGTDGALACAVMHVRNNFV